VALSGGSTNSFSSSSNGYNLIGGGYTSPFDSPGDQTGITNPYLGPLANNGGPTQTHAVLKVSRALNAIPKNAAGCGTQITKDQRGIKRPQGKKCDIGAYEKEVRRR
jgi:hypothetical protein